MNPEHPLELRGLLPITPLDLGSLPPRAPQEIDDRKGEAQRIGKRLLAIMADHQRSAQNLSVAMDQSFLLEVIDALLAEASNSDPEKFLSDADEIRGYLKRSLYEELLEEPSNILFTTQVSDEVIRYEAMEVAFWRECLEQLRAKIC